MKTILPIPKMHALVFLIAFLFVNTSVLATTFYLKNANVTTANNFTSWNTDSSGGGAGVNATTFANAADVWVILTTQNAIFANGTTTTIAGTLQVVGTLQVANNPSNNVSTTLNVTGTVLLSRTSTSQVTLSNAGGSGNTTFALGTSGVLKTANINGVFGTSCSIAPIGNKSTVTLPATATYEFNGAANQSTTGLPATVSTLVINNSGGSSTTNVVSLAQSTTVSTSLFLLLGNVNIGNFNLTVNDISITPPTSSSKMVIASGTGELRKRYTSDAPFTFPIGDNTGSTEFSPITLAVSGNSYTNAYVGVRVTNVKHPNNASTSHFLNRYWSITQSGITTCNVSATATYTAADVSGTETSISAARLQGAFNQSTNPWEKYGVLNGTLTTTSEALTAGQTTVFTGLTTANPTVSILGGDMSVCQNANITLTASPIGDSTFTYLWTGLLSGSNTTAAVTANTSTPGGPNFYSVTVIDGNGISATSASVSVTVTPTFSPTVSLVSDDVDATFCAGTNITFTATANNLGGGTVVYDFKVDGSSVQNTASNSYSTTGLTDGQIVTVTISVSDGTCLTTTSADSNSISNTVTPQLSWYLDADGDGYYTGSAVLQCDSPGVGYTTTVIAGGDCNDASASINPSVTEICYNNIDDNCDGLKSEGCAPVIVNMYPQTSIASFTVPFVAVPYTYPGATTLEYRFRIKNLLSNETRIFSNSTSRYAYIPSDIRSYNTNYEVSVSAIINGEDVAFAGNTITVTSPSVQSVNLSSVSCNSRLFYIGSSIASNAGPNALSYTFRIRLTSDNPTLPATPTYYYVTTASRFVGSNSFVGLSLQYNTVYSVSVKYTFNNNDGLGIQEAPYGAECTITTPSIPVIGLSGPICGTQLANMSSSIAANPALYAIKYRFRIRLTSDNPTLPALPSYSTSLPLSSRFTNITTMQQQFAIAYSTSYMVSVQYSILINGNEVWSDYGPECELITPAAPAKTIEKQFFVAKAYPNPFANNFFIDLTTEDKSAIGIKVYDMIGRLVDVQVINEADLNNYPIGDRFPSGVYNVVVTQGDEVQTLRVVKR